MKKFLLIALAATMVFAVTACGGFGDKSSEPTESTSKEEPRDEPKEESKDESQEEPASMLQALAEKYPAEKGVRIEYEMVEAGITGFAQGNSEVCYIREYYTGTGSSDYDAITFYKGEDLYNLNPGNMIAVHATTPVETEGVRQSLQYGLIVTYGAADRDFEKASKDVQGQEYDSEVYKDLMGDEIFFCFDEKGELVYVVTSPNEDLGVDATTTRIKSITSEEDETLYDISEYTIEDM